MGMRWIPFLIPILAACASDAPRGRATLETDGAWVRLFRTDRDSAYHAALQAFRAEGYSIDVVNPLGGTIQAKSPVRDSHVPLYGDVLRYRLARVDLEEIANKGTRVRLVLTDTREPAGHGRDPTNDRPVRERAAFEAWFEKIETALGG